jgi:hypothetical protein
MIKLNELNYINANEVYYSRKVIFINYNSLMLT